MTDDLFANHRREQLKREAPLAARMRPRTLEEFVGQEHIIGPQRLLRRAIESDRLFSSLIFWGPPGTGKTTLAMIIANTTRSHFETLSAVMAGVADIRRVVQEARERLGLHGQRTILLVDETHRFNRAQQDALLPHVEDGTIILIGSTTENPYFEVVGPLLSRSRVFSFRPLDDAAVRTLLKRALSDRERGYGGRALRVDPEALEHLVTIAGGDARSALNALELAVESTPARHPRRSRGIYPAPRRPLRPRRGRALRHHLRLHPVRARLRPGRGALLAGQDGRRRRESPLHLPSAIHPGRRGHRPGRSARGVVVNACAQGFEWVGLPEGQYHLALATLYLAIAPKSNAVGAYWEALAEIEEHGAGAVPLPLRNKSDRFHGPLRDHYRQTLGKHEAYRYPHDAPSGWVAQQYLPDTVTGGWFRLKGHGYEAVILRRLRKMKKE